MKFFSVYIDCNPESESTLWSCDAIVEFRLISQKSDIPNFSRQASHIFETKTISRMLKVFRKLSTFFALKQRVSRQVLSVNLV